MTDNQPDEQPDDRPDDRPDREAAHHCDDFISAEDRSDAEEILFAHPPRRVSRVVCGCGEDYPCDEVRFALLIQGVA